MSPEPEAYNIALTGPGISVERTIPVDKALQIVGIVLGQTIPASSTRPVTNLPLAAAPTSTRDDGRRLSLREFWDEAQPKRMPDKIVTIGYYLQNMQGAHSFTRDDVKSQFRVAGEPIPGNLPRDWTWAVSSGWIAENHDEPGFFYVTKQGEKAIEAQFSGDIKKSTSATRRLRSRKRRGVKDAGDAQE